MRRIYFIVFVLFLISCNSQTGTSFTVEGVIKNSKATIIYLEQNVANREHPLIVDSSEISKDGSFRLTTTTKEEGLYSLRAGHATLPFAVLINDSKKITVNADLSTPSNGYTINGSPATQELIGFDQMLGRQMDLMSQYSQHYDSVRTAATLDSSSKKKIMETDSTNYEETIKKIKNYIVELTEKTRSPSLTIYAVTSFQQVAEDNHIKGFTSTEISQIVDKALSNSPENATLKEWKKFLRPGKAPEFTATDTSGKPVSLTSFKGKYVLLDFWASWCKPCRSENPNVVAAFNQFRNKNFTILSVSLDDNKQAWLNAIQTDGLIWNHVSDLKGWESQIAALYGVQSIPYNFLIDPDGNIVAEDIRGGDLFNALNKFVK